MDEDALAPMADALSATLAVFILLICFFVMAQVDAVSRQIKVENVGTRAHIMESLELNFDKIRDNNGQFVFYNSFAPEKNLEAINKVINKIKKECLDCKVRITSNYPVHNSSEDRAIKRAMINALKMASVVADSGLDYEIKPITKFNYYFVELEGLR
ncbi:hypothetical protein [Vibrio sp. D431a]|uniref:hypothetical protein n=1 Tax=Vibrio sp. D431a TaxID=2837388 RepID=UPI002556B625|nr:hypothetical protein [Vibrio sp. D431a]MDK9790739.1 hypothetical protein [Vibrio sp. D431a]